MEEKKSIKISLSFVLLVIAIMIILLLVFCLYFQKTSYNRQIATLENNIYEMSMNSGSMQNKIDELQGKLGTIANIINEGSESTTAVENTATADNSVSNTVTNTEATPAESTKVETTDKKVDKDFTLDEVKSILSADSDSLKTFFATYSGKYVKVTGYAVDIGQDNESFDGVSYYINLSEENNDQVYVCGYSQDKQVFEELKKLSPNQRVTVYGTIYNGTLPLTLTDITIEK